MSLSEECKTWKVYIHTFPNGKKYIGITKRDVTERWKSNGVGYKDQKLMWSAISKYGWDNIKHEIVMYNLTESEAVAVETALIKEMNTYNIEYGYNISIDWKTGFSYPQKKSVICLNTMKVYDSITEAAEQLNIKRKAISQNCLKQRKYASKTKDGIPLQFEYYDSNKTYTYTPYIPRSSLFKPVICLNTLEIFDSVANAAKKYNLPSTSIAKVCRLEAEYCGHDNFGYGLSWAYYDDSKEYVQKFIPLLTTKVICLNTLQIFDSVYDAAKFIGATFEGLLKACKGRYKYLGTDTEGNGLQWSFYIPGVKYSKAKEYIIQKKVICLNTLEIFDSALEVSKKFDIPITTVTSTCRKTRGSYATSKKDGLKYAFQYYDPKKEYIKVNQGNLAKKAHNCRKVMCIETGEIFQSIKDASKKTKISRQAIMRNCLNNSKKSVKIKYTFKYVD